MCAVLLGAPRAGLQCGPREQIDRYRSDGARSHQVSAYGANVDGISIPGTRCSASIVHLNRCIAAVTVESREGSPVGFCSLAQCAVGGQVAEGDIERWPAV